MAEAKTRDATIVDVKSQGRSIPKATVSVLLLTALGTGMGFVSPSIADTLQRTPGALSAGQWWRLITPIFINPEGWRQIAFNFLGIAVVGAIVERILGSRRWLILYFVGGLVGELAGFAWQPTGAGSSVAGCGLLGALALWLLRIPLLQARIGGAVILGGAVVLIGMQNLHGPPLLVGACLAAVMLRDKKDDSQ